MKDIIIRCSNEWSIISYHDKNKNSINHIFLNLIDYEDLLLLFYEKGFCLSEKA